MASTKGTIFVTVILPGDYSIQLALPKQPNNRYSLTKILDLINDVQKPSAIRSAVVRAAKPYLNNNGPEVFLFDQDTVYLNNLIAEKADVTFCHRLNQDNEGLGPSNVQENDIKKEGIAFLRGEFKDEGILNAIGHNLYYLPQSFCNKYVFPQASRDQLPRLRITSSPPFFVLREEEFFIDYFDDEYLKYMKKALKLYCEVFSMFRAPRNESHWQNTLYRRLISLAGLHADVGGLEALQIHKNILEHRNFTSDARSKFNSGLKPDIADGWLVRHEEGDEAPTLKTPNGQVFDGKQFKEAVNNEFKMGDDMFLLVDLLVELKKDEDTDVDKFKAILEAAGCLACFENVIEEPIVFLGTGNCTAVRLYFSRQATNSEKLMHAMTRPKSQLKSEYREIQEIVAKPYPEKIRSRSNSKSSSGSSNPKSSDEVIPACTIVKELFSDKINCIDSLLQFAAILWRIRVYRKRSFNMWYANKIAGKTKVSSNSAMQASTPVSSNPSGDKTIPSPVKTRKNNNVQKNEDKKSTENKSPQDTIIMNSHNDAELSALWGFNQIKVIEECKCCKILQGVVAGQLAILKIDQRLESIRNEVVIYEHLMGIGFELAPKLLNKMMTNNYGAILISYVNYEQIFGVDTVEELVEYIYHLLKAVEQLHSHGIIHGDIKPSNVMVDKRDGSIHKILFIDFAFSHILPNNEISAPFLGFTAGYTSPEVIKSHIVMQSDDIYSIGATLASMACESHLKDDHSFIEIWDDIRADRASLCNEQIKELINKMTGPRESRPTASALLQKEIFKRWSTPLGSDEEMRLD